MEWRPRVWVLAGLPLVALALGGATAGLGQGLVVAAMGLILALFPLKRNLSPVLCTGVVALLGWCALAFLPAGWVVPELWRTTVEEILGHPLSPTISAQPWMTFEAWGLLAAGLAWAVWMSGQALDERERGLLLRLYLLGVFALAVVGLSAHIAGHRPPFWDGTQPGPFPNRNQSANVLALAAVAGFSLGLRQLYHGRKKGWAWLGLTLGLLTFLASLGSRAGLVLFFAGAGAVLGWDLLESRKKTRGALGMAAAMLLLAIALMVGGESVDRVMQSLDARSGWKKDTRLVLQLDAVEMAADQPVMGLGLGNFDGVFGMYRDHYRNYNRPIHPESDWVWWLCETGLPGLVLLAGLVGWLLVKTWPGKEAKDRRLRRAAWLILAAFALHGLVDVSGHRLGTVLAVLVFLPLALPAAGWVQPPRRQGLVLAGMGVVVFLFGSVLVASALGRLDWPGRSTVERLRTHAIERDTAGRQAEALEAARRAQKLAPLDWRLYFLEGCARLGLNMDWQNAERAFYMVRILEPDSPYVPFEIGSYWLGKNSGQVLAAWKTALKRRDEMRPGFFQLMYKMAERDPETLEELHRLANPYPDLVLFTLDHLPEDQFEARLAGILERNPVDFGLGEEAMQPFFKTWRARRGDERFLKEVRSHSAWLQAGWWMVAYAHAGLQQWKEALDLAEKHLVVPALPMLDLDEDRARESIRKSPGDLAAGLFLFDRAMKEGNLPAARKRLDPLLALPERPAYLDYLDMRLCRQEGRDAEAWAALTRYRAAAPRG